MREDSREYDRDFPNRNHDATDASLPEWAVALLQEPAVSRRSARAAIMDRVRAEPVHAMKGRDARGAAVQWRNRLRAPMRPSRWHRRGLLTPFGAAALAGLLALVIGGRSIGLVDGVREHTSDRMSGSTRHDGVEAVGISTSATVLRDTVVRATGRSLQEAFRVGLRDTLRVVELVLRGPDVARVAVVGDFNAWQRGATPMERRADGSWYAQVVVPRDVVRFAYVVNTRAGTSKPAGSTRVQLDSI
ncbi:MAG TPA: hypothetical protein VE869_01020 [Gemmatimonas sp.]|nr:hypothetical protein [Gemmatimonas sp.]